MMCQIYGRAPAKTRDPRGRLVCGKTAHQLGRYQSRRKLLKLQRGYRDGIEYAETDEQRGWLKAKIEKAVRALFPVKSGRFSG